MRGPLNRGHLDLLPYDLLPYDLLPFSQRQSRAPPGRRCLKPSSRGSCSCTGVARSPSLTIRNVRHCSPTRPEPAPLGPERAGAEFARRGRETAPRAGRMPAGGRRPWLPRRKRGWVGIRSYISKGIWRQGIDSLYGIPMFQHYTLSACALTCALLRLGGDVVGVVQSFAREGLTSGRCAMPCRALPSYYHYY